MERGRSGLDPLKGDRSIIVISSVDNNGHWPLGEAALLPLLPPSPIHLPLILERIDRASRILGFQGWFTGPLSLPTLRIVDFVPVESGIAYLLELSILRNSTPSCRIVMGEVSKSSFDRIKSLLFSRPAWRIFRRSNSTRQPRFPTLAVSSLSTRLVGRKAMSIEREEKKRKTRKALKRRARRRGGGRKVAPR